MQLTRQDKGRTGPLSRHLLSCVIIGTFLAKHPLPDNAWPQFRALRGAKSYLQQT